MSSLPPFRAPPLPKSLLLQGADGMDVEAVEVETERKEAPVQDDSVFMDSHRLVWVTTFPLSLDSGYQHIFSEAVTDAKGNQWCVDLYPDGLSNGSKGHISLFLKLKQADGEVKPCKASFAFALMNRADVKRSKETEELEYNFDREDTGYRKAYSRDDIFDAHEEWVDPLGGTVQVATYINIGWSSGDDNSKLETGMVGLKNQGATCYMNSLLQTYYHLHKLRRAVYDIPTQSDDKHSSVALAMQRVFYRLQTSSSAVATQELTKSFGWDTHESFLQQDVQELNRVLCDKLEEKMKGTPVEGVVKELFEGRTRNYIKCVDVDYTSQREETFYDVQLDVKGCKDIYESLAKYVEEETMDGDNMYEAEGHGKQVAKKGIKFLEFPPVLSLQLKRFQFDVTALGMTKVNDMFEFPAVLDVGAALADDVQRSGSSVEYVLHSVLVHRGDVNGGHYYAFVRLDMSSESDGRWVKFDDDTVNFVHPDEAILGSYGYSPDAAAPEVDPVRYWGAKRSWVGQSFTSAYMLVYIKASLLGEIMMGPKRQPEIPEPLAARFREEEEEEQRRRHERQMAHLYGYVRLACAKDVRSFTAYTEVDDFVTWESCLKIKVAKGDPVSALLEEASKVLEVPAQQLRLWTCCKRENKTCRPDGPLQGSLMEEPMEKALSMPVKAGSECKVYVEELPESKAARAAASEAPEQAAADTSVPEDQMLLFFKQYHPELPAQAPVNERLAFVGQRLVPETTIVSDLAPICADMAGLELDGSGDLDFKVYEDVTPNNVSLLQSATTLKASELQHGDILCFQLQ
ncbi:unnamed protein product, partial [Chrysoparadoxa australica]